MTDVTNLRFSFLNQLLLCVTLLLFSSCSKEPLIGQVDGQVVNRVDGAGIPDRKVTLTRFIGFTSSKTVYTNITDDMGNFKFVGGDLNHLYLRLPKYTDHYPRSSMGGWCD